MVGMADRIHLLHPVELGDSTHEERVQALTDALEQANRVRYTAAARALFDCYLIVSMYERGNGA